MQGEDKAGDDDVGHGDGQEELPAEAHELVVAETGERASNPDEEQKEGEDLDDEPEDRQDRVDDGTAEVGDEVAEGAGSSAEEEQGSDAAYGDHVGVLGHEEHGELHRAVLGVVAGGKLRFRFRQIEGGA